MFGLRLKHLDRYSQTMKLRVLIADDHPLFRDALRTIVHATLGDCEISEALDYSETSVALEKENFNVVFLDLNMPNSNGLSDLALLKKTYPHIPIVVVSAHDEDEIIRSCLNHNASGYIIKSSSPDVIQSAIKRVMQGETVIPEGVSLTLNKQDNNLGQKIESLTPSQLKVFIEMGKGKLNKQIAYDLKITEATVKAHVTTVFKKLGINNRTQAVIFAQEHRAKKPITPY